MNNTSLFKIVYILSVPLLAFLLLSSCNEDTLPKPRALLRLNYPETTYTSLKSDCPYTFEISKEASAKFTKKCWVNIYYPKLRATIDITYRNVNHNIKELLRESEKLTYNHAIKADAISTIPFENKTNHKYGALSEVTGNAASPIQFHLTDSTQHFITGALYFEVQPNYDSILPAIKFIEKDIAHLMETLKWQKK